MSDLVPFAGPSREPIHDLSKLILNMGDTIDSLKARWVNKTTEKLAMMEVGRLFAGLAKRADGAADAASTLKAYVSVLIGQPHFAVSAAVSAFLLGTVEGYATPQFVPATPELLAEVDRQFRAMVKKSRDANAQARALDGAGDAIAAQVAREFGDKGLTPEHLAAICRGRRLGISGPNAGNPPRGSGPYGGREFSELPQWMQDRITDNRAAWHATPVGYDKPYHRFIQGLVHAATAEITAKNEAFDIAGSRNAHTIELLRVSAEAAAKREAEWNRRRLEREERGIDYDE